MSVSVEPEVTDPAGQKTLKTLGGSDMSVSTSEPVEIGNNFPAPVPEDDYEDEDIGDLENGSLDHERCSNFSQKQKNQTTVSSSKDGWNGENTPVTLSDSVVNDYPEIPDCELKIYVREIAKMISKTNDILPILRTFIKENWLETISHLESLSETDWMQLSIPRQFLRLLRQHLPEARDIVMKSDLYETISRHQSAVPFQACGSSTASASLNLFDAAADRDDAPVKPVIEFINRFCTLNNLSQTDRTAIITCIVDENWFDSLEQLRELTTAQWSMLKLPRGVTDKFFAAVKDSIEELPLETIINEAGLAFGKSPQQLQTVVNKLKSAGITNATHLKSVPDNEWTELGVPFRLSEEIKKIVSTPEQSSSHLPVITTFDKQQFDTVENHATDTRIVTNKDERDAKLITVDRFLLKVGMSVGKKEAEMTPIIEKVVKENWFEDIKTLRSLSETDWHDLGLPKRLVDAVRRGIEDPVTLEFNLVQFSTPDSSLFPCDVYSAVWKLDTEVPSECMPDTLRALLRLMETLICNPFDETKRVIRKSNPNFKKKAGCYKSALLILEAVGYETTEFSIILPVAYMVRITEAHAALAQLAQTYTDRLRKLKKPPKNGVFSAVKRK